MTEDEAKTVVHYNALLFGWIITRLAKDLLIAAVSIIGLIHAVITVGSGHAAVCFMASILSIILVLRFNADYLDSLITSKKEEEAKYEIALSTLDGLALISMALGCVFTGVHVFW